MNTLRANLVDVLAKKSGYAELCVRDGRVDAIEWLGNVRDSEPWLLPGLVDAHVHIESSMLVPDEFARAALCHGVVASVSDPHEIANVLGLEGVRYMIARAALTPFHVAFGAPSCVPATPFESAGATLSLEDIEVLLQAGDVTYLSEMMNYPGVLNEFPEVMAKLALARKYQVPVDGHAPGLIGADAARYASAGISTDHECTTLQEAEDKIAAGMKILIREGSAAKDFSALQALLTRHPDQVMLCSDDKHPDDLLQGHIDDLVRRALQLGHDLYDVLRAATVNPVQHYWLPVGLLQPGDAFDAILVDHPRSFQVQRVWLHGELVVENGQCLLARRPVALLNCFHAMLVAPEDLELTHPGSRCRVIEARDGQLWTRQLWADMPERGGLVQADLDNDILFLVVMNRYQPAQPAVALIKGFGLRGADNKGGAIASSVGHDSHNIVAVGTSPAWVSRAINLLVASKGGLAAVDASGQVTMELPVAGLMSDRPAEEVGPAYAAMNQKAHVMGSQLSAPFMTLSFMALLVIPELKLSDQGLFDGNQFTFVELADVATESANQTVNEPHE